MRELRTLKIKGGEINIVLYMDNGWVIEVDGVEWVRTDNRMHAVVLFEMMHEHLLEYMHFEAR